MKKQFKITIGEVKFNKEHNFFHGYLNGRKVTMNMHTDDSGEEKWLVTEEITVYEVKEKVKEKPQSRGGFVTS